ncbi:metallophosphoesterase [uncultured Anaerococcus sp.]|uniref:metallophosphoesterase n=1 Tax=uncultured Anaerococcus sp. TaxID=293428 RepID=UPI0026060370|nr:metallophosphoesterase [uncultured Anaerococcus sp.]
MIYAIADLHLDYTEAKSMEVFGEGWANYQERIFTNWESLITDDDTVLIPGDISWAMDIANARVDLARIDGLKGKKILMKGNHDYWRSSLKKLDDLKFESLSYLQNNHFVVDDYDICGTRGRIPRDAKDFDSHDEKIFNRELIRLENSFKESRNEKKIVLLHYPPLNVDGSFNEFFDLCKKYEARKVIYGHLHGVGHKLIKEGKVDGIDVFCVAGDYIDFMPVRIV